MHVELLILWAPCCRSLSPNEGEESLEDTRKARTMLKSLGFRVQGLGFRVQGSGVRV